MKGILLLVFAYTDFMSHVSTKALTILAFNAILDFVKYSSSFYLNPTFSRKNPTVFDLHKNCHPLAKNFWWSKLLWKAPFPIFYFSFFIPSFFPYLALSALLSTFYLLWNWKEPHADWSAEWWRLSFPWYKRGRVSIPVRSREPTVGIQGLQQG